MKKGIVLGIVILLILLSFIPISYGNTENISDNIKHCSIPISNGYIQNLIDDASDGDTIFIPSGIYYENIVIDKSISLIGEDKDTTVIDGNNSGNCVNVNADWVNISGFTIQYGYYYGIEISSKSNTISSNNILNNKYLGISIDKKYCNNNIIKNNNISNNYLSIYDSSFNTIRGNNFSNTFLCLDDSEGNIITGNSFFNAGLLVFGSYQKIVTNNTVNDKPLVYLENESDMIVEFDAGQVILVNCNNITVRNQEIYQTICCIELFKSDNCLISGNSINSNDEIGLFLVESYNNTISGNKFSTNAYGISLSGSKGNTITENEILNNWCGIEISFSSYNTINWNNIKNNDNGILLDYSDCNTILRNNFINNRQHAFFIKEYTFLEFIKDYWSSKNIWNENYWIIPRLIPKTIFGFLSIIINSKYLFFLSMEFDWHPAKEPYNYTTTQGCGIE